jgi:hypothetical protein
VPKNGKLFGIIYLSNFIFVDNKDKRDAFKDVALKLNKETKVQGIIGGLKR